MGRPQLQQPPPPYGTVPGAVPGGGTGGAVGRMMPPAIGALAGKETVWQNQASAHQQHQQQPAPRPSAHAPAPAAVTAPPVAFRP
jgi:hypothetical protein